MQTAALPLSYADHVPGFRRAEGKGKEGHCPFPGWCIRRAVNPVGGGKEGEKPAPDGCVLVAIADKAHTSNFRGGRAFYMGMDTQYPDTIKRGRSSRLRNRGGGTGWIRTGTMSGYVVPTSAICATVPDVPPRTTDGGGYSVVQAVENCIYAFWDAA